MRILESKIENQVGDEMPRMSEWFGVPILYLKLNILGKRGFPDRIILWKGGFMFIEFKRPGEKPRKLQLYWHRILRDMGFEVQVHDNRVDAVAAIAARIHSTLRPDEGYGKDAFPTGGADIS